MISKNRTIQKTSSLFFWISYSSLCVNLLIMWAAFETSMIRGFGSMGTLLMQWAVIMVFCAKVDIKALEVYDSDVDISNYLFTLLIRLVIVILFVPLNILFLTVGL